MSAIDKSRAAQLRLLSEQANEISALLSTAHVLADDERQEAMLDCSSLADDFAKDLNSFVATRVPA